MPTTTFNVSLVASYLLMWSDCDTDELEAIIDEEASYRGTYQMECLRAICLVLEARSARVDGYVLPAELAEATAFDFLCATGTNKVMKEAALCRRSSRRATIANGWH
jgi:hypothetical protein